MTGQTAVPLFGLGAALIGFWLGVRFPKIGPQSVHGALIVAAAMFVLQTPLLNLVSPVAVEIGTPAALLLVILPSLTLLFWATGCLVRSLVAVAAPYRR